MTKDGIREKVRDGLKRLYDEAARAPVPQDMLGQLAKLK